MDQMKKIALKNASSLYVWPCSYEGEVQIAFSINPEEKDAWYMSANSIDLLIIELQKIANQLRKDESNVL